MSCSKFKKYSSAHLFLPIGLADVQSSSQGHEANVNG